jgi:diaminopropionate ammonia-lyase
MKIYVNERVRSDVSPDDPRQVILDEAGALEARSEITSWAGYQPTPLVELSGLAKHWGLGALWYKDESKRFGLKSFKALGGAYAVARLVRAEAGERQITVCCATDGNHGRAVAWGAEIFGCGCVIYVHPGVSAGRRRAIEAFGAEVREVPGNYDDSVRRAAEDAEANGWFVISDTSWEGYVDVPREVMLGYTVMVDEVCDQLGSNHLPTHVFVQGGVGGLSAAVCARLCQRWGTRRPRFIVVEPERAACLYESARMGRPTPVSGTLDTVMAGLAAGEVSLLAWVILEAGADAFMTVSDQPVSELMQLLARGVGGDPPLEAGESAVAGLIGCSMAREALGLGADSRVLVFGTEGATDPELYQRLITQQNREEGDRNGSGFD